MVIDFPYHKELLLKKEFAPFGSKFFPLSEVPILKRMQLKRITACSSSHPLMCVTLQSSSYATKHDIHNFIHSLLHFLVHSMGFMNGRQEVGRSWQQSLGDCSSCTFCLEECCW